MAFNTSSINNIPPEVMLNIFSMFRDIKDVIKFSNSSDYAFAVYKNNLSEIINKLIVNNRNNGLVNYVIVGAYNKKDSIDKKLHNIKLIADFLSKNDNNVLNEHYKLFSDYSLSLQNNHIDKQKRMISYYYFRIICNFPHKLAFNASNLSKEHYIVFMNLIKQGNDINISYYATTNLDNEKINIMKQLVDHGIKSDEAYRTASNITSDNIERFFELVRRDFFADNAIIIINNFNEMQINKMEELIQHGFKPNDASEIVQKYNDMEIQVIIQITSINNALLLINDILTHDRNEAELQVMLELVKNNFNVEQVGILTNNLVDLDNFNNEHVTKIIELKNKGISEKNILNLFENDMFEEFNFENYDRLIEVINDSDTVIEMIIDQLDDIDKVVELINDGISGACAIYLINNNYSKEQCLLVKPYLEYIKHFEDINYFIINYDEIIPYIQMFQENNLNAKYVAYILITSQSIYPVFNFTFISDIIRIIKLLQGHHLDDEYICNFITCYTYTFKNQMAAYGEPQPKKQMISNIYELPQLNACISFINKGIINNHILMESVKMMYENDIDIKYIDNLNEEDADYVKNLNKIQLDVFLNLCKDINNTTNVIILMKKLNEDAITKIYNFASNTGNSYIYSLRNYIALLKNKN